jgi:hypothetical protein
VPMSAIDVSTRSASSPARANPPTSRTARTGETDHDQRQKQAPEHRAPTDTPPNRCSAMGST